MKVIAAVIYVWPESYSCSYLHLARIILTEAGLVEEGMKFYASQFNT